MGDKVWVPGKTDTGYLLRQGSLGAIGHPLRTLSGACATQFGGPAVHNNVVIAPCTDDCANWCCAPPAASWTGITAVSGG